MRNFKVDPLFRGPRTRVWPREKVYTQQEVIDVCRKRFYTARAVEKRRTFVFDRNGGVVTRLVETTRQANSDPVYSTGKTFVVPL